MMVKYLEYKDRYAEAILFFQVGDFYELFFDDAVTVSRALNLTLTSRDKNHPEPIPMCGVPISVIDSYIDRLVSLGHSVAIVSQRGSPQAGKQIVDRELERIVTPGMRLFSNVDSDQSGSAIVAVALEGGGDVVALAWSEAQSGIIVVEDFVERAHLASRLGLISPKEVVLPRILHGERVDKRLHWVRNIEQMIRSAPLRFRGDANDSSPLTRQRQLSEISGFVELSPLAKRAVRSLVSYIDESTVGHEIVFNRIEILRDQKVVALDAATRRNLELVSNARDNTSFGSLWWYLNDTRTPAGARLLRKWILSPLSSCSEIKERLATVRGFYNSQSTIKPIQELLSGVPDLERIAARLELQIASPRDLASLRDAILKFPTICTELKNIEGGVISSLVERLDLPKQLLELLTSALADTPPHTVNEGGIIRPGFSSDLDHLLELRTSGDRWMSDFESQERGSTGISTLKVKQNNVIGYFIEITTTHSAKAPTHYIRRQSTANAERFTTSELRTRETEVFGAISKQYTLEKALFEDLRNTLLKFVSEIRRSAEAVATLDVFVSLAQVALRDDLIEPEVNEGRAIEIVDGRHPVIARHLEGAFVPNGLSFSAEESGCYVITGPNMGGKSTFLRQAAIIIILAQMGSFVPAKSAQIGLVDKVFARIGASDDIHEGDSTFMVEMREAAHILASATDRSLVLIDELGRGTATSDGIALAQSILESLVHTICARTLFATHYHELTSLQDSKGAIKNLSVGSTEEDGQVIFTHAIQNGPAPRSYGIEVAKLSGLSSDVIERAVELLDNQPVLEANKSNTRQLDLFALSKRNKTEDRQGAQQIKELEAVKVKLLSLDVDGMTPREALSALYELRRDMEQKASKNRVGNG